MTELWSRKDIARVLGVTVAYVDMIRHKLPEPIYVGRLPRWVPEEVVATVKTWRGNNGADARKAA